MTTAPAMDEDLSTIPNLFPASGFDHSNWYVASGEATNELPNMSFDVDLKELASAINVGSPLAAATATTTVTTTTVTATTTTDGLQGWSLISGQSSTVPKISCNCCSPLT